MVPHRRRIARNYQARNDPPSVLDVILDETGLTTIAWGGVVLGVASVADGLTGYSISLVYANMPALLKVLAGVFLTIGAGVAWFGMVWQPKRRFEMSWAVERGGWITAGGAAAALAIAAIWLRVEAVDTWIPALSLVVAAALRVVALTITQRAAQRVDEAFKDARDDGAGGTL